MYLVFYFVSVTRFTFRWPRRCRVVSRLDPDSDSISNHKYDVDPFSGQINTVRSKQDTLNERRTTVELSGRTGTEQENADSPNRKREVEHKHVGARDIPEFPATKRRKLDSADSTINLDNKLQEDVKDVTNKCVDTCKESLEQQESEVQNSTDLSLPSDTYTDKSTLNVDTNEGLNVRTHADTVCREATVEQGPEKTDNVECDDLELPRRNNEHDPEHYINISKYP